MPPSAWRAEFVSSWVRSRSSSYSASRMASFSRTKRAWGSLPASGGVRRCGSASLDLCYLAEGILDADLSPIAADE